ncbi:MAG: hypothetical protein HN999_00410 [Candidatus Marinimicrobia bacterium]|jgi:hypothetical protein|nr:hypothetical protein [Candidatus Neomarinimicrobiota bacterium]MBT6941650.1 hypothetical protein [Candidatus Neomarinimicrobiota bacterium]MBT7972858.1 hypothetical protein [Candidatus Neomarinimicrobiota bacterium]
MNNRLINMMSGETWDILNQILENPEEYCSDRFCLQYFKHEGWAVYKLKPSLVQITKPNKGLEDQELIQSNANQFQVDF